MNIDEFYEEDGKPVKCPNCISSFLSFITKEKIDGTIFQYEVKCAFCNKELGYWAYGYYNPLYRIDLINKEKWSKMFAEIAEEIKPTTRLPPYTEEKKEKLDSDFREIMAKLLDPLYEITIEDQMKIVLHAKAIRATQFLLNQKKKKEAIEKEPKALKALKALKENKEKIKIPTKSEYKNILIASMSRDLTQKEEKQKELFEEQLLKKVR